MAHVEENEWERFLFSFKKDFIHSFERERAQALERGRGRGREAGSRLLAELEAGHAAQSQDLEMMT